jgi:hypothetical protein
MFCKKFDFEFFKNKFVEKMVEMWGNKELLLIDYRKINEKNSRELEKALKMFKADNCIGFKERVYYYICFRKLFEKVMCNLQNQFICYRKLCCEEELIERLSECFRNYWNGRNICMVDGEVMSKRFLGIPMKVMRVNELSFESGIRLRMRDKKELLKDSN